MIAINYKCKDLTINTVGATEELAFVRLMAELSWFRERFPTRRYPAKPRKYTVYHT